MGVFTKLGEGLRGLLSSLLPREQQPRALNYSLPPEQQEENAPPEEGNTTKIPLNGPQFQIQSEWTTQDILDTLDAHELGDFSSSARLWDWCQRDPRLATELAKREKGLNALPFSVHPASDEDTTPQQQEAAVTLEKQWFSSFGEDVISSLIRNIVGMGFALCQLTWQARPDDKGRLLWWPCLELWHAQFVFWDENRKQWRVQTREGFQYITPGDGQWVLFMPSGQRGWLAGAVRSLSLACFITLLDQLDWADFNDAVGHPVKIAYIARGTKKEDKTTFLANLALLGRKTNVLLCQKNADESGYDAKYLEPSSIATESFKDSMEVADRSKTLVILGQELTTVAGGSGIGGGGPAAVHKMILATLLKADANGLETTIHCEILNWWAFWNFAESMLAPWPFWDLMPPEDKKLLAETIVSAAKALEDVQKSLAGTGNMVDPVVYWSRFDLPIIEVPPGRPTQSLSEQANTTRTVGYVMESISKGLVGSGNQLDVVKYCGIYSIPLLAGERVVPGLPAPAPEPAPGDGAGGAKDRSGTPAEEPAPTEEPKPEETPPEAPPVE